MLKKVPNKYNTCFDKFRVIRKQSSQQRIICNNVLNYSGNSDSQGRDWQNFLSQIRNIFVTLGLKSSDYYDYNWFLKQMSFIVDGYYCKKHKLFIFIVYCFEKGSKMYKKI